MPRDVSALLKKIQASDVKKIGAPKVTDDDKKKAEDARSRVAGQDAAKARARAKEAESNLKTANELIAEKDEQLESLRKTVEAKDAAILEMKPASDNWKRYEARERAALEAKIPVELKGEVKGMPLNHLKLFVERGGLDSPDDKKSGAGAKGGKADINKLAEAGDMEALNAAIDAELSGSGGDKSK